MGKISFRNGSSFHFDEVKKMESGRALRFFEATPFQANELAIARMVREGRIPTPSNGCKILFVGMDMATGKDKSVERQVKVDKDGKITYK